MKGFKRLKHEPAGTDKMALKQYGVMCSKRFYGRYIDREDGPLGGLSTQDFLMCPASPLVISEGKKFIEPIPYLH